MKNETNKRFWIIVLAVLLILASQRIEDLFPKEWNFGQPGSSTKVEKMKISWNISNILDVETKWYHNIFLIFSQFQEKKLLPNIFKFNLRRGVTKHEIIQNSIYFLLSVVLGQVQWSRVYWPGLQVPDFCFTFCLCLYFCLYLYLFATLGHR